MKTSGLGATLVAAGYDPDDVRAAIGEWDRNFFDVSPLSKPPGSVWIPLQPVVTCSYCRAQSAAGERCKTCGAPR